MKLRGISIILAGCLFLSSCKKSVKMIDCVVVENGLLAFDESNQIVNVLDEINKLCIDLKPEVTENDRFGHQENLNLLIERLNKNCNTFTVALVSYATIKTNPVQSEIKITLNDNNESYVIDIKTPEDDILKASNIHK